MMIKDLGLKVEEVWKGLRPMTKDMLVGALKASTIQPNKEPQQKFAYDTHADWELSRLLSAIDEHSKSQKSGKSKSTLGELNRLAETCASVLEAQSGAAEVFVQLATRALERNDFDKLDHLGDRLASQFSAGEIAEVIRQTEVPHIRAIAFETLAMLPVQHVAILLDDPLYTDIAVFALEQMAFEFESEEARDMLDYFEQTGPFSEPAN